MFNILKRFLNRFTAVSTAAAVAVGAFCIPDFSAYAEEAETVKPVRDIVTLSESETSYAAYIRKYSDMSRTVLSVYADTASYNTSLGAECELFYDYEGMPNTLYWTNGGTVTFPIEVPAEGLYNLELIYRTSASDTNELSLGVLIDGELPFDEAEKISLDKYWKNKTGNIQYDSEHQNQIRPTQVIYDSWITYTLLNKSSFSAEPFSFMLTAGEHTVTLQNVTSDIYISRVNFTNTSVPKAYSDVKPTAEQIEETPALMNGEAILVEAEVPSYTNSTALQATREPSEYLASPAHPTQIRFNTIGGTVDSDSNVWDKPSQKAVYEVNVPADGYYSINLRCRRDSREGLSSYRKITVNGVVPCKELSAVRIDYSPKWQTISLNDENGEPIYFYLSAGTNTIEIEAVTGDNEAYAEQTEQTVKTLREIISASESRTPEELLAAFKAASEELDAQNAEIRDSFGVEIDEISELSQMLKSALKKPEKIAASVSANKDEITGKITALITRLRDFHYQPLELDYFEIKTVHEEYRDTRVNVFKAVAFAFRSFIGSFFKDFSALRQTDTRTMEVWVCLDRKQAEIVSNLVERQYNPTHDIKINIRPDNGDLYSAVAAGKGPQAALYADSAVICELQERGAVVNLKDCQSFDEVYARFPTGLSGMYSHDGGVYAVPLTNDFPLMFYRTDIFSELEITPPDTWEEFYETLPIIYENGMKAGMISSESADNGFAAGDLFIAMLNQTEEKSLDSDSAAAAFEAWTKLCADYGLTDEDMLGMFRTGEMPLVFADCADFSSLLNDGAYELAGRWSVAHIPGTYRTEDGLRTLDCSVNTNSLGAVIFDDCKNVSAVWEFISWFTSDEIQLQVAEAFGLREYSPANIGVSFPQLWSERAFREIVTQKDSTLQLHEISASADVKNAVYSALRRALKGEDARTAYFDELRHHRIVSDSAGVSNSGEG
ncbi:MAG: extracellular solute-binding protein [Oscillospiraceae bacterium]